MLARVDDAGGQQSLVVVKSLLSSAAHHQRAFDHEADMFASARYSTTDCHVVRLLGVCCSLQPPLIVTEYCQLVCTVPSLELAPTSLADFRLAITSCAVSCTGVLFSHGAINSVVEF